MAGDRPPPSSNLSRAQAGRLISGIARLLPSLIGGRTKGPLCLTGRKVRVQLAAADLDPGTGRARLSYRRAAELFTAATATYPSGPWTLRQLRHSALTHAAEDGANTSTLLAFSGHTDVAGLARYARVSADALTHWQHQPDPQPTTLTRALPPLLAYLGCRRTARPDLQHGRTYGAVRPYGTVGAGGQSRTKDSPRAFSFGMT
ncbi:hypothetical protein [Actinoallomurus sp. NPDC050550]|uniref:hypothetical protein n=1 Tax=Actinoallomurus sp. NPDC050550 TaxID=3154937 RepID=UPI0033E3071C